MPSPRLKPGDDRTTPYGFAAGAGASPAGVVWRALTAARVAALRSSRFSIDAALLSAFSALEFAP